MRPIYGCREHFRQFLSTPTVTFPFPYVPIDPDPMNVHTKFEVRVASPVPEIIIRDTFKNWTVLGYAHAPFSLQFFDGLLFRCTL